MPCVRGSDQTALAARMLKFAPPSGTDDCWNWTGSKTSRGYGTVFVGGRRKMLATHAALDLSGRPRPSPKHYALHACDNPSCVNPAHLRWGTQTDNMADMYARDRHGRPNRPRTHCKNGHSFAEHGRRSKRTGWFQECVICRRAKGREEQARRRAKRRQEVRHAS
jgi:hypothetical protein